MQNSFFEPIEPCYKKSRQTRFFRILRKMFCKSLLNAVAAPWRHGIKPGVTVSLAQHHAKRSSPPRVAAPCSSKPQRSATRNTKPPATPSYTQQRRANARVPAKPLKARSNYTKPLLRTTTQNIWYFLGKCL